MTFEPKPLQRGWQVSCLRMIGNLLYRGKRDAVLVFLLLPCLLYFLPTISLKMLCYAFCIIAFYCYCLKYDTHQSVSWFALMTKMGGQFQVVVGVATAIFTVMGLVLYADTQVVSASNMVSHLIVLPMLGFVMYFGYLFGMLIAIPVLLCVALLVYLAILFWFMCVVRSSDELVLFSKKFEAWANEHGFVGNPINSFTVFGPFLFMHSDLNWGVAGEYSKGWLAKQSFLDMTQVVLVATVCVMCMPFFILGIPFLYAVYKHIFWNGELESRQPKSVESSAFRIRSRV